MYEQNEFTNPFSHSPENMDDVRSMGSEAQFGGQGRYSPSAIEFTSTLSSYNPQQTYITGSPGNAYNGYTVTQYPANWMPTGPLPVGRSSVDSQSHILQMSPENSMALANWSNLQPGTSNKESSSEGQASQEGSPPVGEDTDSKKKERKERRRAQNRVAQRLFRARREVSLKESASRLENLEDEVGRLHSNNDDLSDTVSSLKAEIQRLRKENVTLKRRLSDPVDEQAELIVHASSIFADSDDDMDAEDTGEMPVSSRTETSSSSTSSLRHTQCKRQRSPGVPMKPVAHPSRTG